MADSNFLGREACEFATVLRCNVTLICDAGRSEKHFSPTDSEIVALLRNGHGARISFDSGDAAIEIGNRITAYARRELRSSPYSAISALVAIDNVLRARGAV